jgi:CRISPR-associated protein Csa2
MTFLSLAVRAIVNLESLNTVESVGNLSRHRIAPVVLKTSENSYSMRYVPVVSGETIAHAYQSYLVDLAQQSNLPLGRLTSRHEFIKYSEDAYLEGIKGPDGYEDSRRFEVDVMLYDVVADIGGFLYAGKKTPVRRTSRFQVGYMMPALDAVSSASLESQFHVRMALSLLEKGKAELGQIPYNVEVGSALYTFTFNLDVDGIAKPSTMAEESKREKELQEQRPARIRLALEALLLLLTGMGFGGKRSRFLPNTDIRAVGLTISERTDFVISPGNSSNFVDNTIRRAQDMTRMLTTYGLQEKVKVIAMSREEDLSTLKPEGNVSFINATTAEEVIRICAETVVPT